MPRLVHGLTRRNLLKVAAGYLAVGGAWTTYPLLTGRTPSADPAVVGHRGAAGVEPPNTIAAIRTAIDADADGVELDVRQTSDGKLVLFHDPLLSRATDGIGLVNRTPWEELQEQRIDGERIPSLAEGLEELDGESVDIYLELKRDDITEEVHELVRQYDLESRTTMLSFSPEALRPAADDRISTGLLSFAARTGIIDDAVDCGASMVLSHYVPRGLDRFIEAAHEAELSAGTWELIGTTASIRDAVEQSPDVLVTNHPGKARRLLDGDLKETDSIGADIAP